MPFVKGQSGNPDGRPMRRAKAFRDLISDGTPKQIATRIVRQALKGRVDEPLTGQCLKLCMDRLWPALTRQEQTGVDGGPVEHNLQFGEARRHLTRTELKQIQAAADEILAKGQKLTATPVSVKLQ